MDKILVQLSGGYDSTAVLIKLLKSNFKVFGIFVNYGQPYYENEKQAVEYITNYFKDEVNFNGWDIINTDLELTRKSEGSPSDYIPVRNLVLGSICSNYALANGYNKIAVGNKTTKVRKNDPWSFSDCSYDFYSQLTNIVNFCAEEGDSVEFIMPLLKNKNQSFTKAEVIQDIYNSGLDFNKLWSCYDNNSKPCGGCHHCLENKRAFEELKINDPINYC